MDGMMDIQYRHIPKSEVRDALSTYIYNTKGVMVQKVWEMESIQPNCKHACSRFGLSILNVESFEYCGLVIPYWFCSYCGTLRVWLDYN